MDLERLQAILAEARRLRQSGRSASYVNRFVEMNTGGAFKTPRAIVTQIGAMTHAPSGPGVAPRGATDPGAARDTRAAVRRGMTLGFSDEAAGGLAALFGGDYTAARDSERAAAERGADQPGGAFAELIGGALLPGFGTGAVMGRAATPVRAALAGIAAGGAAGATAGAGYSDAPTVEGRLRDAVGPAAAGAGATALLATVLPALGGLGRALWTRLHGADAAAKQASARQILEMLVQGGHTPETAQQALQAMERVRPGLTTLADLAESTRRGARAAGNLAPRVAGEAEGFYTARGAGAGRRVADDLRAAAGIQQGTLRQVRDAQERLRATGRRVYGPLEEAYPQVHSEEIQRLLGEPEIREMFERVVREPNAVPGFENLQAVRARLRDRARDLIRSGAAPSEGIALARQVDELTEAMHRVMPELADADRAYARQLAVVDAFEEGADAMRTSAGNVASPRTWTPQRIAERLEELADNPAALRAFRTGMVDQLAYGIDLLRTGRDATLNLIDAGPALQAKLRAAFPDEAALDRAMNAVGIEGGFQRTQNAMRGNSTTAQQTSDALAMVTADAAQTGVVFGPGAAMRAAGRGLYRGLAGRQAGQLAERTGGLLTRPIAREPETFAELFDTMGRMHRGDDSALLRYLIGAGGGAAGTGTAR